jgi:hypothetical protein
MAQHELRFGKDAPIVSRDAAGLLTLETPDAGCTSQEQAAEALAVALHSRRVFCSPRAQLHSTKGSRTKLAHLLV